jgi:hypothetical protein
MNQQKSIAIDNANAFKRLVSQVDEPSRIAEACNKFVGQPMLFFGGCIQPASTADILSDDLFIRIVSESDLRPASIAWDAWVEGEFLGYCHPNRVVFLSVTNQDYQVGDSQ